MGPPAQEEADLPVLLHFLKGTPATVIARSVRLRPGDRYLTSKFGRACSVSETCTAAALFSTRFLPHFIAYLHPVLYRSRKGPKTGEKATRPVCKGCPAPPRATRHVLRAAPLQRAGASRQPASSRSRSAHDRRARTWGRRSSTPACGPISTDHRLL